MILHYRRHIMIFWSNNLNIIVHSFEINPLQTLVGAAAEKVFQSLSSAIEVLFNLQYYNEIVEIFSLCESVSTPFRKHKHVLRIIFYNAWSLAKIKKFDVAWPLWLEVYRGQEEILGLKHNDTRMTISQMTWTVAELDKEGKPEVWKMYLGLWRTRIENIKVIK